jgi:hypothetical protein
MSLLSAIKEKLLGKSQRPGPKRVRPVPPPPRSASELPAFSLETAELMRLDPQIRIGLGARNGLLMPARVQAVATRPEIADFVQQTWDQIWRTSGHVLLRAKLYGFLPLEATFRIDSAGEHAGRIVLDHLQDYHPRDARIVAREGDIAGFQLYPNTDDERLVLSPLGIVCTFDSEFGNPYGISLLHRAYAPWYEKWMHGGAKKLLRLRMLKDAYIGDHVLIFPLSCPFISGGLPPLRGCRLSL